MDISEVIKKPEYAFLQTNPRLGNNIMFLCFGGSHAYGTNTSDSDIDIRGCAFNSKADLLGMSNFEQVLDNPTDTVIYGFNKLVGLLVNMNPNTIELLGCKPEHYVFASPVAHELIANKELFLSKKAIASFGGYAMQQLRRLQSAIARDALGPKEKEQHLLNAMRRAMMSFESKYAKFDEGCVKLYIDKSNQEDVETEIFMDASLTHYPLRDYKSMWAEFNEIVKVYGKLNHRNNKKDNEHLNKHAQHLIRLYLMVFDILERGEIITYRADDLELLSTIRDGEFLNEDGTYRSEFFELVDEYEKHFEYAAKNTDLPAKPNMRKIEEFVMSVNERVVLSRLR